MTRCGSIQYHGVSPRGKKVTLSQHNEILAFQGHGEWLESSTLVFDVKSGHLIWQSRGGTFCTISPWFLRETPILRIPDTLDISLYNARSGAQLNRIPEIMLGSKSAITFKHQIATVDDNQINLFDTMTKHQSPTSLTYAERITEIDGNQLIVKCHDKARNVSWIESRNIETADILWTTDPLVTDHDLESYTILCDERIAARRNNHVAILEIKGVSESGSLCERARFRLLVGCGITSSPDGRKLSYFNRKE